MKKALVSGILLASFGAGCAQLDALMSIGDTTHNPPTPPITATTTIEELEKRDIGAEVSAKIKANVSVDDDGYNPKTTMVGQGATIMFKNTDTVSHSITSDTGKFDLGVILPRNSKSLNTKNLKPGTYGYHDALHPELKGTIKIHE